MPGELGYSGEADMSETDTFCLFPPPFVKQPSSFEETPHPLKNIPYIEHDMFCKLLSRMLNNVCTEGGLTRYSAGRVYTSKILTPLSLYVRATFKVVEAELIIKWSDFKVMSRKDVSDSFYKQPGVELI